LSSHKKNSISGPRCQGDAQKKARTLPDVAWLKREIDIRDVASALGLSGDGKNFNCPSESHPAGKPRRSLSIHGKTNTARCFACNNRQLSTIDLTMTVLGIGLGQAITWLDERFHAPRIRCTLATPPKPGKYKADMTLENLIRSPRWVDLDHSEQAALLAIAARCPQAGSEQWSTRCSYDTLAGWIGASRRTAARVIDSLRKQHFIRTNTVHTGHVTNSGMWIKQLYVTISAMALQPLAPAGTTATSYEVPPTALAVRSATDGTLGEYYEHDCGAMVEQGEVCKTCQEMESVRATGDEMPAFVVDGAQGAQDRGETHTWQL
jgi:hypothetical protein